MHQVISENIIFVEDRRGPHENIIFEIIFDKYNALPNFQPRFEVVLERRNAAVNKSLLSAQSNIHSVHVNMTSHKIMFSVLVHDHDSLII